MSEPPRADAEGPHERALVRIRGRVQGVGFRMATRERARALGLAGWVRNLADGRVEACFEGPAETVEEGLAFARTGPRWSTVEAVEIIERGPVADGVPREPLDFEIRRKADR